MFLIYGTRNAKIKYFSDQEHCCPNCKTFDLDVYVYRKYFHILFVPIAPIGEKTTKIYCTTCGNFLRSDSIQKTFESKTKTPIYFYTLPLLFLLVIVLGLFANMDSQREKKIFVENPKVGDVYTISKNENDSTKYYFLQLASIKGDTITAYHNNLVYYNFVSKLSTDDFFVKDEELIFTKKELEGMLKNGEINEIERNN